MISPRNRARNVSRIKVLKLGRINGERMAGAVASRLSQMTGDLTRVQPGAKATDRYCTVERWTGTRWVRA